MLNNTPTVCRKYYVHPEVLDAYLAGAFEPLRARRRQLSIEEAVVALLSRPTPRRALRARGRRAGRARDSMAA
jgi:DNA topoisomerase-1